MNTSSWVVFKNLLERGSSGLQSSISRYLAKEELEKLESVRPSKGDPFSYSTTMEARLSRIHYSWLIIFLEPFAENDKMKILSVLDKPQSTKLQNHFKLTDTIHPLKEIAKDYLASAVYEWIISGQKEFLPFEFLPNHPLNVLLDLSKRELQALVDYLGLHDLAMELKHVIKSEQIKKIQKVLSKEEREYLKSLLKTKEPLSFARLNLDGWNGDGEKLKTILHRRGFNRLAKALFGCHPSLLWHICHRLDTGRTKILRKFFTDINNDEAHQTLTKQLLGLISKVYKGS